MGNIPLAGCSFHFLGPQWNSAAQWSRRKCQCSEANSLNESLPENWPHSSLSVLILRQHASFPTIWNSPVRRVFWGVRNGPTMRRGLWWSSQGRDRRDLCLANLLCLPRIFQLTLGPAVVLMWHPVVYKQDANLGSFCKWHSLLLLAITLFLSGILSIKKLWRWFCLNFYYQGSEVFCALLIWIGREAPCNNIVTYNAKYLCFCWFPESQSLEARVALFIHDTLVQPWLHLKHSSGCRGDCKDGWDRDEVGRIRTVHLKTWMWCVAGVQKDSHGRSKSREIVSSL